jgi:hypothetical protein
MLLAYKGEWMMQQNRETVIWRDYQKNAETQKLIVARISGNDIIGTVFQLETWFRDDERLEDRITSGNKYWIRQAFIGRLLQLQDSEWKRVGTSTSSDPELPFFDPEML